MLQKIRSGDIDFMISSTANAATVSPESGIMSVHFLFRDESSPGKVARRSSYRRGDAPNVRGHGTGWPRSGARDAWLS